MSKDEPKKKSSLLEGTEKDVRSCCATFRCHLSHLQVISKHPDLELAQNLFLFNNPSVADAQKEQIWKEVMKVGVACIP